MRDGLASGWRWDGGCARLRGGEDVLVVSWPVGCLPTAITCQTESSITQQLLTRSHLDKIQSVELTLNEPVDWKDGWC